MHRLQKSMIDTLVVPALAVLLWFWSSLGVRCVVSVRVRATFNPSRYASNGCHFRKIKASRARLLTRPYIKHPSSGQHHRSAAGGLLAQWAAHRPPKRERRRNRLEGVCCLGLVTPRGTFFSCWQLTKKALPSRISVLVPDR